MDIGTLTGSIVIENEVSGVLNMITQQVNQFAEDFDGAMETVAKSTLGVVAAIGGVSAAIIALGNRGSDINDVAATLENFAGSAENAAQIVERMRAGVQDTVSDFELSSQAARLLSANVHLTAEQFGTLSEAAFVLSNRGLGSTKDMMDLVGQAMITGRTRSLAMKLGVIEVKDAELEFANQLGITKDRLTEAGRVEARRIAIMKMMEDAVRSAGKQEKDFGEIMTSVVVKIKNWGDELASSVASSPRVLGAVKAIGDAVTKEFGGFGKSLQEGILSGIEGFADIISSVAPPVIRAVRDIKDAVIDLWNWLVDLNNRFDITGTVIRGARAAWDFLQEGFTLVQTAVSRLMSAWSSLPDWLQNLTKTALALGGGLTVAAFAVEGIASPITGFINNIDKALNIVSNFSGTLYSTQQLLGKTAPNVVMLSDAYQRLTTTIKGFTVVQTASEVITIAVTAATNFWSFAVDRATEKLVATTAVTKLSSAATIVWTSVTSAAGVAWSILTGAITTVTTALGINTAALATNRIAMIASTAVAVALGTTLIALPFVALGVALAGAFTGIVNLTKAMSEGRFMAALFEKDTDNWVRRLINWGSNLLGFGDILETTGNKIKDVSNIAKTEADLLEERMRGIDLKNQVNNLALAFGRIKSEADIKGWSKNTEEAFRRVADEARSLVSRGGELPPFLKQLMVLYPELTKKIGDFTGGLGSNGDFIKTNAEKIREWLQALRGVDNEMAILAAGVGSLTKADFANVEVMERLIPQIHSYAEAHHGQLTPALRQAYDAALALSDAFKLMEWKSLEGLTLEYVQAQKNLGRSEAEIARQFGVTTAALQRRSSELMAARKLTDELAKAQDKLVEQQDQLMRRRIETGTQVAEIDLGAQVASGAISAEQFARQRLQVQQSLNDQLFNLDLERVKREEDIAKRELSQQLVRGELGINGALAFQQKWTAIVAEYASKREDIYDKETARILLAQGKGAEAIAIAQRNLTEEIRRGSMTQREIQEREIDLAVDAQIQGLGKITDANRDEMEQLIDIYRKGGEFRKQQLFRDNEALRANTQKNLNEVRDRTWNTYKSMAAAPEVYSSSVRAAFRLQAMEASEAAKGLETYAEKIERVIGLVDTMSDHFVALAQLGGDSFQELGRMVGSFFTNLSTGFKTYQQAAAASVQRQAVLAELFAEETGIDASAIEIKAPKNLGVATALFDSNAKAADRWGSAVASAATLATGAMTVWEATAKATTKAQGAFIGAMSGAQAGAAFGPWGAAIGAGVGALTGFIRSLTAGRRAVKDFAASFDTIAEGTGFDELHKKLQRLGKSGEQMWINLTQKTGRGDVEAAKRNIEAINEALDNLDRDIEKYDLHWSDLANAQDEARLAGENLVASYDRLIDAGFDVSQVTQRMAGDMNQYIIDAVDAGVKIPAAMRPIIISMYETGQLTAEATAAILGLRDSSVPSLAEIKDAADRYGISLDSLGPKVKQLQITELATQYVADWKVLTAATDDWGVLIDKMRPKVQELVTDAIRYGSTLPEAMRPMIQAFVDAGALVDENGEKLTDLSKLTFAKDLAGSVDALITKLDELIDTIKNGVGGALDSLGNKVVTPTIKPRFDDSDIPDNFEDRFNREEPEMLATGGPVYAATGKVIPFTPRGTDTVPAMLTPGEGVLNTSAMSRLGLSGLAALNSGSGLEIRGLDRVLAVLSEILRAVQSLRAQPELVTGPELTPGMKLPELTGDWDRFYSGQEKVIVGFEDLTLGAKDSSVAIKDIPETTPVKVVGLQDYLALKQHALDAEQAVTDIPGQKRTEMQEVGYAKLVDTSRLVIEAVGDIPDTKTATIDDQETYTTLERQAAGTERAIGTIPASRGADIDSLSYATLGDTAVDARNKTDLVPFTRGAFIDSTAYMELEVAALRAAIAIAAIPRNITVTVDYKQTGAVPTPTTPAPPTSPAPPNVPGPMTPGPTGPTSPTTPAPIPPPTRPGPPPRGFQVGTRGLDFEDFGEESPAELHGEEAVIPRSGVGEFAKQVADALGTVQGPVRDMKVDARQNTKVDIGGIHINVEGGQQDPQEVANEVMVRLDAELAELAQKMADIISRGGKLQTNWAEVTTRRIA